jgi:hypothetical protein
MGILMKPFWLIFFFIQVMYGEQYVFLLNKYDKEIELEAKIISSIALASMEGKVKLYIPSMSSSEQKVYSKYFNLVFDCKEANFVFDKHMGERYNCLNKPILLLTNNYRKLIENPNYYGAFFWNKSRPNIVFIKERLKQKGIILPQSFNRFIEDESYE